MAILQSFPCTGRLTNSGVDLLPLRQTETGCRVSLLVRQGEVFSAGLTEIWISTVSKNKTTQTHAAVHTHTHTRTDARTHTYAHARARAHTHMRARTHTHTQTKERKKENNNYKNSSVRLRHYVIVGSVATFGVGGSVAFAVSFGRCFAAAVGVFLVLWMIYLK